MINFTTKDKSRFFDKVKRIPNTGCWEWQAFRNPAGYGMFGIGKRGAARLAHRVSWVFENGQIPKGLCVLHKCDNPACVNPSHLFLGTRADNSADMVKKKRQRGARGVRNQGAKLNPDEVKEIRNLIRDGLKYQTIADRYGVSFHTISAIARRVIWKHI